MMASTSEDASKNCKTLDDSADEMLLSFDVNSFRNEFMENPVHKDIDQTSECSRDSLSLFFESSQVLRQLETLISKCDQKNTDVKNEEVKAPKEMKLKQDRNDTRKDTIDSDMSRLYRSSQYPLEVADVFRKLESTICQVAEVQDTNFDCNLIEDSIDSNVRRLGSQVGDSKAMGNQLLDNLKRKTEKPKLTSYAETGGNYKVLGSFYDLPIIVKELIEKYKGITSLYEWQDECLNLSAIKNRNNLVYVLPTSGGKTLVSEILILREILCRKKNVLFVLPYVAIVKEKVCAFSPFALDLDFLVEEYAAGRGAFPPRKRRYKHSIYIATIEKALALVNSLIELDRVSELGLVVIDELHLVGEPGRGATLETLLTKLMYAKQNIQIVGMSATIGNLPEICKFLKAEKYTRDFRPVELKEYVKCGKQLYEINHSATTDEDRWFPVRELDFKYSSEMAKNDPDLLIGLVMEVVPKDSCLVFCASKKNCENVAKLLCRGMFRAMLDHRKNEKKRLILGLRKEGELCPVLQYTIPFGVAYHHSGLTSDERQLIETAFRNGVLCCICCTSTLAAGVNLPARRVILRSPYVGRDFISLTKYKQMVGRAGRAGFGEIGESILVCDQRDLKRVVQLLCSQMEHVESRLLEEEAKGLRNMVLSCIVLGTATTRRKLREITACTLLAVQQDKLQVSVKKRTDDVISELFKRGALQLVTDNQTMPDKNISTLMPLSQPTIKDTSNCRCTSTSAKKNDNRQIVVGKDSQLIISKLGKAAIRSSLDLDTAHLLYEDLVQAQCSLVLFTCLHLLYLVTPYDLVAQIQPSLPNYYSIYTEQGLKELQTAKILGINEACGTSMLTGKKIKSVDNRTLNRFYLTLVLYDLWNGKSVFKVANRYQVDRGIVQQLIVSAATFSSSVVRFCEELDEFCYFTCLFRDIGLKLRNVHFRELEPLMEMPSVNIARARQLFHAGYKTLQSIAKENPQVLTNTIEHMSYRIANQLIASAKLLLLERVENLREEAEDVLEGITASQNNF